MKYRPKSDNIKQQAQRANNHSHSSDTCVRSLLNEKEVQKALERLFDSYPPIHTIIHSIYDHAGTAYLVGGAVRDLLLGLPVHDLDIEVHDLTMEELTKVLSAFGLVSAVGKSFGVLKIHSLAVDWALPRTDTSGRKPQVSINPMMGIEEALRRRDLTMNALAIELKTMTLLDPFGGREDMVQSILRSPDISFFGEDPLRFYRVMQFIGRFSMYPDPELTHMCETMDISHVSIERIEDEFEKLMLKSTCPSLGLRWLAQINRLAQILPELAQTQTVKQDPIWHPEGNVFEHLMQATDASSRLSFANNEERLIISYAALCHDLGKFSTTIFKDGRIRSPGHAEAGVPLTKKLLKRITRKNKIIDATAILVKCHMQPGQFIQLHAKDAAYRRLALRLATADTTIEMLGKLCLADHQGRNPQSHEPLTTHPHFIKAFLKRAQEAESLTSAEKPVLLGRDISDLVLPGPMMGKYLRYAYEVQLDEGIKDKDTLRKHVIQKMHQDKKNAGS